MLVLALLIAGMLAGAVVLVPPSVYAQDENGNTAVLTDTAAVGGTIQIVADDPQAIRTLLEGRATIPGDYANYGWATFWALVFGGLGGLVFELLRLRGLLPLPHLYPEGQLPTTDLFKADSYIRPKRVLDLGFMARVFVGAMAALAVLLVISPPERMQFIAATILAGSAGASIFDSLRARLTASLAVADAAEVRMKSQDLQVRLNDMETLVNQLLEQSRAAAPTAAAVTASSLALSGNENGAPTPSGIPVPSNIPQGTLPAPQLNVELLDRLSRTLGEAQGIRSSMERSGVLDQK
jgi:hypothetical protein